MQFTGGMRSFFDIQVGNVYDEKIAGPKKRIEEVNSYFRKEIAENIKKSSRENNFSPSLAHRLAGGLQT